jgi:hypothetical protein
VGSSSSDEYETGALCREGAGAATVFASSSSSLSGLRSIRLLICWISRSRCKSTIHCYNGLEHAYRAGEEVEMGVTITGCRDKNDII